MLNTITTTGPTINEEGAPVPPTSITETHRAAGRVAALIWQASLITDDPRLMSALATLHLRTVGLLPDDQTVPPLSDHPGVDQHTSALACLDEAADLAVNWDTSDLTDDAGAALLELLRRRDTLAASTP